MQREMQRKDAEIQQKDAEMQRKDAKMQTTFCNILAETASYKFNVPVSDVEASLEGLTLKALDAVRKSLTTTIDYDEFVKIVLQER